MKYLAVSLLRVPESPPYVALDTLSHGGLRCRHAAPLSASAQGSAGLIQRLDSIAGAEVRANRSVGIVAAAFKGKDKLLLKAYGKADVEGNAPMTVGTIIPIGSVTKQFTAVAILQLRDQGKLSLDDEVTKWLPELNTGGNRITLRQILAHTGGIAEAGDMQELRAIQLMRNATVTRDSVYKVISRYPPVFPAGTLEMYSNTGYWLLGRIVEKASGIPYDEYVAKRIFAPLRMSRSMYCANAKQVPESSQPLRHSQRRREPQAGHRVHRAVCRRRHLLDRG